MRKTPPKSKKQATAEIESIDFGDGVVFRFCRIPAGTRGWVGSRTINGLNDFILGEEDPARLVTLEYDLWLLQTPVTQAQYRAVMAGTGWDEDPSEFKGDDRPVETLSCLDALRFCNAFSRKCAEMTAPYQFDEAGNDDDLNKVTWNRLADGLRLPMESEWELACRAGACTEYYAGDGEQTLRRVGWFDGNAGNVTHPVGHPPSFVGSDRSDALDAPAHPLRLHDLHGNVWEWCWDAWEDWGTSGSARQATLLDAGYCRTMRGGSWDYWAAGCRSAFRYGAMPWLHDWEPGLRPCLVRSPAGIRRARTEPASDQPTGPQAGGAGGADRILADAKFPKREGDLGDGQ